MTPETIEWIKWIVGILGGVVLGCLIAYLVFRKQKKDSLPLQFDALVAAIIGSKKQATNRTKRYFNQRSAELRPLLDESKKAMLDELFKEFAINEYEYLRVVIADAVGITDSVKATVFRGAAEASSEPEHLTSIENIDKEESRGGENGK